MLRLMIPFDCLLRNRFSLKIAATKNARIMGQLWLRLSPPLFTFERKRETLMLIKSKLFLSHASQAAAKLLF